MAPTEFGEYATTKETIVDSRGMDRLKTPEDIGWGMHIPDIKPRWGGSKEEDKVGPERIP